MDYHTSNLSCMYVLMPGVHYWTSVCCGGVHSMFICKPACDPWFESLSMPAQTCCLTRDADIAEPRRMTHEQRQQTNLGRIARA